MLFFLSFSFHFLNCVSFLLLFIHISFFFLLDTLPNSKLEWVSIHVPLSNMLVFFFKKKMKRKKKERKKKKKEKRKKKKEWPFSFSSSSSSSSTAFSLLSCFFFFFFFLGAILQVCTREGGMWVFYEVIVI